jgi:hypothetical protein
MMLTWVLDMPLWQVAGKYTVVTFSMWQPHKAVVGKATSPRVLVQECKAMLRAHFDE